MLGPKKRAERIVARLKECREKTEAEIVRLRADLTKANDTIAELREGMHKMVRCRVCAGDKLSTEGHTCNMVGARALLKGSDDEKA